MEQRFGLGCDRYSGGEVVLRLRLDARDQKLLSCVC